MTDHRSLPVKLTDEEIRKHADREAYLEIHERELLVLKKASAAKFKSDIDSVRAERLRCAELVSTKTEKRKVECKWKDDFKGNKRDLFRSDTKELVETKPMSATDRQSSLKLDTKAAKEEAATVDAPALTASVAEQVVAKPAKKPRAATGKERVAKAVASMAENPLDEDKAVADLLS